MIAVTLLFTPFLPSSCPKERKIMKTKLSFRINFNPYIGSYYEDCIGFSKTDDAQYIDRKKLHKL